MVPNPVGWRPTGTCTGSLGLHDAIPDRHSDRGPYTNVAVSDELLDSLTAQTGGLDGVELRWFTTDSDKAALSDLPIDATEAIVADPQQSKDSFAWFRNDRSRADDDSPRSWPRPAP